MPRHYSLRIRLFLLWVGRWDDSSEIYLKLDGRIILKRTYAESLVGVDECSKGIADRWLVIDTGDFAHSSPTARIETDVTLSMCSAAQVCKWSAK